MSDETQAPPAPAPAPGPDRRQVGPGRVAAGDKTVAVRRGGGARRDAKAQHGTDAPGLSVAPPVGPARVRARHRRVVALFIAMVVLPTLFSAAYLWTFAVDQYESRAGFTVRAEGQPVVPDVISGIIGAPAGSTDEDMSILNEYILSQEMVALIDARLDLRTLYAKPSSDPFFAFRGGTIEDLTDYWDRMVLVDHDGATGLMELRAFAFAPEDAQAIALAILEEGDRLINGLTAIAREDATAYAREALAEAEARLSTARQAIAGFRVRNQMVDPSADLASQTGVLAGLRQGLADALVQLDLLRKDAVPGDPRLAQVERRIEVIEARIAEERARMGLETADTEAFLATLAEYERLSVDREFAEQAYLAARSAHDLAVQEAQRQSRYFATFLTPTLAEASTAPIRPLWVLLIAVFSFLIWSSVVLIYYALRDRR